MRAHTQRHTSATLLPFCFTDDLVNRNVGNDRMSCRRQEFRICFRLPPLHSSLISFGRYGYQVSLVPCPAAHISLLFPGKILKKRNGDTRGWRGDGSRAQPPSTIDRSIPLILENMTPLERSAGGRAGFPPFRLRSE